MVAHMWPTGTEIPGDTQWLIDSPVLQTGDAANFKVQDYDQVEVTF